MKKLPDHIAAEKILNHTNDGIYVTDTDCRILYWNRAAERITGWPADEVVGKKCSRGILMHVNRHGECLCTPSACPLHRAIVANQPSKSPLTVFANHKDGHRVPVAVSVAPMQDDGGKVIAGVEVFRDISSEMRDLNRARLVQRHSIANSLPKGRVSFHAKYLPHEMVGGDYYQVRALKDGRYAFILADVMGHGVSAALYTMTLHALWQANEALLGEPARFMSHMNRELAEQTLSDSFITCFMGVIDPEKAELTYASAAHPAPFWVQADGGVRRIASLDLPLGLLQDKTFSQRSVALQRGDRLLLYSDAALETTSPDSEQFGQERLLALVSQRKCNDADQTLSGIVRGLREFAENVALGDDLTLLAVCING